MSHIEGDGIIEDIYYLLWRKDSPYNEKLNLRIPDTVIFRKGRPMAWYYTTAEGSVMRKKQPSLVYPEIQKKFTKGAKEGEIVAYFVNIDHEKKLERLLDKPYTKAQNKEAKNEDDTPSHDVEYYGLSDFNALFSDYKNFEGKTGILQRFIHPYGTNNELIQAIWSPRVCVFTKRVNLRRLNETRFDIYERALTFDGPDFYSKNVPLRGGYIPGKLRATCDHIVRHIAFISFEKVSINRLVGYFKVDQNENVWFLWTSSIRIGETSKTHKKISQFVDKPLCLEPCMQTSTNIRHIKSNFSTRPVTLRMTEECSICSMKVSSVSLIPVPYRLLLGNEEILKRSEKDASRIRLAGNANDPAENNYMKPKTPKKSSIGVPHFLKKLHPHMTLKEYQNLKEKEHFLMTKAYVCEGCYLIVSKEYEGGFPCSLNDDNKVGGFLSARPSVRNRDSAFGNESTSRKQRSSVTPNRLSRRENLYDSGDEYDSVKEKNSQAPMESSARLYMTSTTARQMSADSRVKSHRLELNPDPAYSTGSRVVTPSTNFGSVGSHNSQFPRFLNKTLWHQDTKTKNKKGYESVNTNLEETKYDSNLQDHSNLKRDVIRALSRDLEGKDFVRSTNSISRLSLGQSISKISSARQPARPQTTSAPSVHKKGRILKGIQKGTPSQYKLDEVPDLFDDSNSSGEQVIKIQKAVSYRQPIVYQTPREPFKKEKDSVGGSAQRPLSTECPDNIESFRGFGSVNKGRNKLKGYLAELNPEAKMQDHLDQDMVLTMENATKKDENINSFRGQPPTISHKDTKNNYSSYSHRGDNQGSKLHQSPYNLVSTSGRQVKIKQKHHSIMNEVEMGKGSGDNIESLIDKYYDGKVA